MKRQTAWNGFYKSLRELKAMEKQAEACRVWACDNAKALRMKDLQVRKYCKALVLEHDVRDQHTARYYA